MYRKILFALLILALLVPFLAAPASAHVGSSTKTCIREYWQGGAKRGSITVKATVSWNSGHNTTLVSKSWSYWAASGWSWADKGQTYGDFGTYVKVAARGDLYQGSTRILDNWARSVIGYDGNLHSIQCANIF